MEVNYLKKDELQYELQLRGVSVTDRTVDEMRPQLRSLLNFENKDSSLHYPKYDLDISAELDTVNAKVLELATLVESFKGSANSSKCKGLLSRLVHLLKRIDRIPTENLPAVDITTRSESFAAVLDLMGRIESVTKRKEADASLLLKHQKASTPADHNLDSNASSESSDSEVKAVTSLRSSKSKSMPVLKWNLKYSGDPKGMSVHTFLERVSELRIARNVSEVELFDQTLDLFEGRALLWYRANRTRVNNWKELTSMIIRHYEPPDYRSRLLQEIMSRTQDSSESIIDYLSCMTAMFERYGNISEELRLDIILKNLAPFYVMQLPEVATLAELETECLKLEVRKYRAEHHVAPSHKKSAHYVEPDFAFVSATPTNTETQACASQPTTSLICWNCQKTGHAYQQCSLPRTRFCYRCGKPNVTVRTCPTCNHSGNANRRP